MPFAGYRVILKKKIGTRQRSKRDETEAKWGRRPFIMKKKQIAVALAILSASSALCLRIMKKVDEKLRREQEKRRRP